MKGLPIVARIRHSSSLQSILDKRLKAQRYTLPVVCRGCQRISRQCPICWVRRRRHVSLKNGDRVMVMTHGVEHLDAYQGCTGTVHRDPQYPQGWWTLTLETNGNRSPQQFVVTADFLKPMRDEGAAPPSNPMGACGPHTPCLTE